MSANMTATGAHPPLTSAQVMMEKQLKAILEKGAPYPNFKAILGGIPNNSVDTPLAAVFLVLFAGAAIANLIIFRKNNAKKHRFIFSGMMFGFSFVRILTMSLRIGWANELQNNSLGLASTIFTAAGVLLLYVVNLFFGQRILRVTQPRIGWSKANSYFFIVLYSLVPAFLIALIVIVVWQRYTLDVSAIQNTTKVILFVQCYLLFIAVLPLIILALSFFLKRNRAGEECFGHGPLHIKAMTLLTGATLLTIGNAYRTGVAFQDFLHPRPIDNPGWYNGKGPFWAFQFGVEVITVYLYLIVRVDKRFHVPNGCRGSYIRETILENGNDPEAQNKLEETDTSSSSDIDKNDG